MKLKHLMNDGENEGEVIVRFGQARLIRRADGKCLLKGGSRDDQFMAREWISLFMHEIVLQPTEATDRRLPAKVISRSGNALLAA